MKDQIRIGYNMQRLVALLMLTALILPAMGTLNQAQTSWTDGMNTGYKLGELAWQSRGNQTAADLYNAQVDKINVMFKATMNKTDYEANALGHIKPLVKNSDLPNFLQTNFTGKFP